MRIAGTLAIGLAKGESGRAHELEIASKRADGALRRWVPVWVVSTGGQVYVRTWYRRETGWFGQVLASHQARIRVPGLEADVAVDDVGEGGPGQRAGHAPTPHGRWMQACPASLPKWRHRGNFDSK